jgi:hypothetical protein
MRSVASGCDVRTKCRAVKPLGLFMARVFAGERAFLTPVFGPLEMWRFLRPEHSARRSAGSGLAEGVLAAGKRAAHTARARDRTLDRGRHRKSRDCGPPAPGIGDRQRPHLRHPREGAGERPHPGGRPCPQAGPYLVPDRVRHDIDVMACDKSRAVPGHHRHEGDGGERFPSDERRGIFGFHAANI